MLAGAGPSLAAESFNCTLVDHADGAFEDVWGYAAGGREYALVCAGNRLDIYDATGPGPLVLVRTVPASGYDLKDVKTRGAYAFAVNQSGPMQVIDLSVPELAYTAASFNTPNISGAHTIHIEGDYAFLSLNGTGARDLRIVSIANPLQPAEVGHWTHPRQGGQFLVEAHDAFVRGDTCYVAYLQGGFAVLDVSDKTAPVALAVVEYSSAITHSCALTADGRHLLTTDETVNGPLRIWDISNLAAIHQVASYVAAPNRVIHDVHVLGGRATISYYTEGLRVVDITEPARPVEVGFFDTFPGDDPTLNGNWGVYPFTPSGRIYLSDQTTGLWVVTASGTAAGTVTGTVRDAVSGEALPAAEVELVEAARLAVTGAAGGYALDTAAGLHTIVARHAGYAADTASVVIPPGLGRVGHDVSLARLGGGALGGRITAAGPGGGIAGVRVEVRGVDLNPAVTGPSGHYDFSYVWAGAPRVVTAGRIGWFPAVDSVTVVAGGGPYAVDLELTPGIFDDIEADQGWTVGSPADSAVSGVWERGDPTGTFAGGRPVEPEDDHSPGFGTLCYVTEVAAPGDPSGLTDVDDGRTTLATPVFDVTGVADPHLRYWRWYSNNEGAYDDDVLVVDVSSNGGASWVNAETVAAPAAAWTQVLVRLAGLVTPGPAMRVRFVASDFGPPSVVEAAIDDLAVVSGPVGIADGGAGGAPRAALPRLLSVVPNPARSAARLGLDLPAPAAVRLAVHDAAGRLVRLLDPGLLPAGRVALTWDGLDAGGRAAPSGHYFVTLSVAGRPAGGQRLVLVR